MLRLLGLGFMLVYVLMLGGTVGGGILVNLANLWMVRLSRVDVFAQFLVPCRLCRGLTFCGVILALQASETVFLTMTMTLREVQHLSK